MPEARERSPLEVRQSIQSPVDALMDYRFAVSQAGAGDNVWAQAMAVHFGSESLMPLVEEWRSAANRGAQIYLIRDPISEHIAYDGEVNPPFKNGGPKFAGVRDTERTIIETEFCHPNIHVITLKPSLPTPSSLPAGRNHIKELGVLSRDPEKTVVWLLTNNLYDKSIRIDRNLAFRFDDDYVARALFTGARMTHTTDEEGKPLRRKKSDFKIDLGDGMDLLVDVGRPGQSAIYKKSLYMLKNGKPDRIVFSSQFPPDPVILRQLVRHVRRGAEVDVYTSMDGHPNNEPAFLRTFTAALNRADRKYDTFHVHRLDQGLMHIKAIALIKDDAVYEALFGTHNIFYPTVIAGTAEAQIYSRVRGYNRELVKKIEGAAA